jgi:mannosyltransferase
VNTRLTTGGSKLDRRVAGLLSVVNRHIALFTCSLVAANLALKLWEIGKQGFWLDEALTVFYCQQPLVEVLRFSSRDHNPPLYYLMANLWIRLFGISEAAIRSLSALLSSVTVAVIIAFARRFLNLEAAVFAGLMFTASNVHLYYAQEARTYSLVSLLCVCSFYLFTSLIDRPAARTRAAMRGDAALLALVNTLLVYSHYVSAWILVVQITIACLVVRRDTASFKMILLGQAAVAIALLPWLGFIVAVIPRRGEFWLGPPTPRDLLDLLQWFAGNRLLLWIDFGVLLAGLAYALARAEERRLSADPIKLALLGLWAFLPLLADYALAMLTPIFLPRYLLYSSIALTLLIAYLISIAPISRSASCAVMVCMFALAVARLHLSPPKPQDWRAAATVVKAEQVPGSTVFISSAWQELPFAYYYDRAAFVDYDSTVKRLEDRAVLAVKNADELAAALRRRPAKLILVSGRYSRLGSEILHAGLDATGYALTSKRSFPGVEILIYRNDAPPT